ncbi:hypothetical protein OAS86_02470 [Gammaproteobacteria bacterium]|nr:hypothetical protein [Gammaproteobacteria bacterium]
MNVRATIFSLVFAAGAGVAYAGDTTQNAAEMVGEAVDCSQDANLDNTACQNLASDAMDAAGAGEVADTAGDVMDTVDAVKGAVSE